MGKIKGSGHEDMQSKLKSVLDQYILLQALLIALLYIATSLLLGGISFFAISLQLPGLVVMNFLCNESLCEILSNTVIILLPYWINFLVAYLVAFFALKINALLTKKKK